MAFEKESNGALLQLIFAAVMMFSLGCGAGGWVAYSNFVRQDEIAQEHSEWLQVPARVTECRVHKVAARYRNQSSHEWLQARYSYCVDGIKYESDEVGTMDDQRLNMFREAAQKALVMGMEPSDFLPSDLCCYVNPNNPREAKLFTDVKSSPWWWIALLFAFYGSMAFLGFWGLCATLAEAGRRCARFFRRHSSSVRAEKI